MTSLSGNFPKEGLEFTIYSPNIYLPYRLTTVTFPARNQLFGDALG